MPLLLSERRMEDCQHRIYYRKRELWSLAKRIPPVHWIIGTSLVADASAEFFGIAISSIFLHE
jgi:hypothetical protein